MPLLPPGELAIAGHAMALSQWHQVGGWPASQSVSTSAKAGASCMPSCPQGGSCPTIPPPPPPHLDFLIPQLIHPAAPSPLFPCCLQAHLFCSRCGAPSTSVDGGARRQCTAAPAHRQYPRTDPVVIMLVESPDGGSALLGRSKKMRPGMLTCLSGFTDQVSLGRGAAAAWRKQRDGCSGCPVSLKLPVCAPDRPLPCPKSSLTAG